MSCEVFDYLGIAALIDGSIFCVHGGLSPEIPMLHQIDTIMRHGDIPENGPFADLTWSDPDDIDDWEINPRGSGYCFGASVVKKVLFINK